MKTLNMNKIQTYMAAFLLLGSVATLSSCDGDDDNETFDPPLIQVVEGQIQQRAGQAIDVEASVIADAGIKSVTASVEGGAGVDVTGTLVDQASGIAVYEFTIPSDAAEGQTFDISFTVTDNKGETASTSTPAVVTVAEEPAETVQVSESANGVGTTTWKARNTYVLTGKIFVMDGQTLTIEPGTTIKSTAGQAEAATALIVARGGKIIANGTAENPIIFTSVDDDLTSTSDLPKNQRGLWGGIVILGNAFINHANGQTAIEGIPTTDTEYRSQYGVGTEAVTGKVWAQENGHNGGELSYVSIRHGGTNIGAGNELNGLTLGGVGTGTKIHHIEVFGNDDDGFEWFGGTVNTSYLASIFNQDDAFDWDFGWRGENQFWVAVQEQGFDPSNRGFESDGAHSGNLNAATFSKPQIFNLTLVGSAAAGTPNATDNNVMFFTENSGALIHNSILMGFGGGINITDVGGTNGNSRDRLAAGDLAFKNNIWTNIADNTTTGISNSLPALKTYLEDAANGNEISDAPGITITSEQFNLVPSAASLALTKSRSALPVATNGFTYIAADYIGAFGNNNWLKGWSAADEYGFLP
jgi:hypothetical protein